MVQKEDTIDEMLKNLLRDVEKLKETPKEDFVAFDTIKMAEQMEVGVTAEVIEPVEIPVGGAVDSDKVGFNEVI